MSHFKVHAAIIIYEAIYVKIPSKKHFSVFETHLILSGVKTLISAFIILKTLFQLQSDC